MCEKEERQKIINGFYDVLDRYPYHNDIYIYNVRDRRESYGTFIYLNIIYKDTLVFEEKQIQFNNKGAFINGRKGKSSKIYLDNFNNLELPEETRKYIDDKVRDLVEYNKKAINSRNIKAGMVFKDFNGNRNSSYSIFIGTIKYNKKNVKYHLYVTFLNENKANDILTGNHLNHHLNVCNFKSKIRACEILGSVPNQTLDLLKEKAKKEAIKKTIFDEVTWC